MNRLRENKNSPRYEVRNADGWKIWDNVHSEWVCGFSSLPVSFPTLDKAKVMVDALNEDIT